MSCSTGLTLNENTEKKNTEITEAESFWWFVAVVVFYCNSFNVHPPDSCHKIVFSDSPSLSQHSQFRIVCPQRHWTIHSDIVDYSATLLCDDTSQSFRGRFYKQLAEYGRGWCGFLYFNKRDFHTSLFGEKMGFWFKYTLQMILIRERLTTLLLFTTSVRCKM